MFTDPFGLKADTTDGNPPIKRVDLKMKGVTAEEPSAECSCDVQGTIEYAPLNQQGVAAMLQVQNVNAGVRGIGTTLLLAALKLPKALDVGSGLGVAAYGMKSTNYVPQVGDEITYVITANYDASDDGISILSKTMSVRRSGVVFTVP